MTFGSGKSAKSLVIKYLVVNAFSSFIILLDQSFLNTLVVVIFYLHLKVKYLTIEEHINITIV